MDTEQSLPQVATIGLTSAQVQEKVRAGQSNIVQNRSTRTLGQIITANVFTLFNGIVLTAMVLVLLTGQWKDSVFGFVIIINTGIGIITELKAKRTLDKLAILVAAQYTVRRDGHDIEVASEDIVLGDTLWIRAGQQVPADTRIEQTWGLELDESMLTGESNTIRKGVGDIAHSGSTAVSGLAIGTVHAVGEHSYAAKLTAQAKVYQRTHSDLVTGINTILKWMTVVVVPLCALLVWTQIRTVGGWDIAIQTGAWKQAVVSSVAGVVGMIPEGLVLLTSLNFAVAAMRLARHNTLVQELEAVETLARVDALNLDKTGTLTDGGIALERVTLLDDVSLNATELSKHGAQQNSEHSAFSTYSASQVYQVLFDISNEGQPNSTAQALLASLREQGYAGREPLARIPFSSARKWSAIITDAVMQNEPKSPVLWIMGAPEVVLAQEAERYQALLAQVGSLADAGSRVLILAAVPLQQLNQHQQQQDAAQDTSQNNATQDNAMRHTIDAFVDQPSLPAQITPIALVTCAERIREDAKDTLAWFREQGVRCRVISGDNPRTVAAIARKVALTGEREPIAMDARELPDVQNIEALAEVLEHVDVLGRVLPEQKRAIVQALHSRGSVVAMTGDGVNDALALKEADLGIAMGNAAPATKAVAQVVLVDSLFSHMPDVVARGRQVMANMERVASLFLVKTVYSALISLAMVLLQLPFPYLPRHITYVGALTIGMPAFILALAPNTRRYIPGFLGRVIRFALPGGIAIAISIVLTTLIVPQVLGLDVFTAGDLAQLRSLCAIILFALGVLVLARVARPLRSWRGWLVLAFALAGVIGVCIPFIARFFAFIPPTGSAMWVAIACTGCAFGIFALCMWVFHKLGGLSHTK
ncbi:haloacid dehalogenase [Galliscardovia ingluviei]|uniref:Haloacid dehalogenase n=1 Tax=Galliscardovia ingluviei TaxID=1769422 RepID=A0A8J3EV26_9BIFI|nr:HAD-IC family P-type ATPase [Galliscardovia ingluviei]GGI12650.1 haloacid dehalogenase [Galliscardovia ingluviei]